MTEEKEKIKKESGVISRREFLKDAGLVVGGAAIGSAVLLAACKGGEGATKTVTTTATTAATKTVTATAPGATVTTTVGAATTTVTSPPVTKTVTTTVTAGGAAAPANVVKLTVNGWEREVEVKPNMTLQEMLRGKLGLTSPKDMCFGYGACGSCGVIMDGRPVLSCVVLAVECDGAVVETAEGIADANHPLIDAYVYNICAQCGYCTPGFLTTTKALLDHNHNPTVEDIREAIAGNICRCATYPAHIRAVLEAATKL